MLITKPLLSKARLITKFACYKVFLNYVTIFVFYLKKIIIEKTNQDIRSIWHLYHCACNYHSDCYR
jgi:hypothetical protein